MMSNLRCTPEARGPIATPLYDEDHDSLDRIVPVLSASLQMLLEGSPTEKTTASPITDRVARGT